MMDAGQIELHLEQYSLDRYDRAHWNQMYIRKEDAFYHVFSVYGGYSFQRTPTARKAHVARELLSFSDLIERMQEIAPLDQWSAIGKGDIRFEPEWNYGPCAWASVTHLVGGTPQQCRINFTDVDEEAVRRYHRIFMKDMESRWVFSGYTWRARGKLYEGFVVKARTLGGYLEVMWGGEWVRTKGLD